MCIFALAFGKQIAMTDALHRWATATSALSSNLRGSRMVTREYRYAVGKDNNRYPRDSRYSRDIENPNY